MGRAMKVPTFVVEGQHGKVRRPTRLDHQPSDAATEGVHVARLADHPLWEEMDPVRVRAEADETAPQRRLGIGLGRG